MQNAHNEEEEECTICFNNIRSKVSLHPCNHSFCSQCIQKWFERRVVCPMCKTHTLSVIDENSNTHRMTNGVNTKISLILSKSSPVLGINMRESNRKVFVTSVTRKSHARMHGIFKNDCIRRINGIECYTITTVQQILSVAGKNKSTCPITIEIERVENPKLTMLCCGRKQHCE